MVNITLNGQSLSLDADPAMPLLYAIRDLAQLTGTKFGCGMGLCGAPLRYWLTILRRVMSILIPLCKATFAAVELILELKKRLNRLLKQSSPTMKLSSEPVRCHHE